MMMMMFFFARPTLSVTETVGVAESRGTGLWDGARGFPADPTPQTACSVIGTAPRVFVRRIVTLIGVFSMVCGACPRTYSQEQAPCR